MRLSVVTSLYNSECYLLEFYERTTCVCTEIAGSSYEIIFVNDGSPDKSLDIARSISKRDSRVRVINLSRNHGHHKALMIGLLNTAADYTYVVDCDLEEKPEWLRDFYIELIKENLDMLFGVQKRRRGGRFERWSGHLFYAFFNLLAGVEIQPNQVIARLMTKEYREALVSYGESNVFFAGLCELVGFERKSYVVSKGSLSPTTYTLARKLDMFVVSITSFSSKPLVVIFYFGLIISSISAASCSILFFVWALKIQIVSGWLSLMASLWLIGGLVIFFLGIIGIYIAKVFEEVKRRPYSTVKAER